MPTFRGTVGPDTRTADFDTLYGLDGRDFLAATQGDRGYVEGGADGDAIFVSEMVGELYGGSGGDQVGGWQLNDALYGGSGDDFMAGGFADFGSGGKLIPNGPSGADLLSGDSGTDALFGLDGADRIYGGDGDDRGTIVADFFGPATVAAGLWGGEGDDLLDGGAGDDDLHGEGGSDTLVGGIGADRFFFDTAPGGGIDRIADFDTDEDLILISVADFAGIGNVGDLKKKAFFKGKKAADESHHVVYHQKSGNVWFDSDGKGGSKGILFAQVDKGLGLSAADFTVIA